MCNTFTVLGLGAKFDWLAAPNADINLPLAMALFVIVLVHIASIRARGPVGYVKHYLMQPFPIFLMPFNLFINLVEEIAKPITLALRLFGNLLSGTLMLSLIAYLGVWKISSIPIGNVLVLFVNLIWKLFDLAIGGIQAFIFALLTILYFDVAMSTEHDGAWRQWSSPISSARVRTLYSPHKITSQFKKGEQSNGRHNGAGHPTGRSHGRRRSGLGRRRHRRSRR